MIMKLLFTVWRKSLSIALKKKKAANDKHGNEWTRFTFQEDDYNENRANLRDEEKTIEGKQVRNESGHIQGHGSADESSGQQI